MDAAITDVPELVLVEENVPKLTAEPATVAQFVPVIEVPVQKTSDSSTVPLRVICSAVLAATIPLSTAEDQLASE